MRRLFYALWPDDIFRLKLVNHALELARESQGRAVRGDTLHLTLVFVGNVENARVEKLAECADRVAARPFDLGIDTAGYFAKARAGWLGCSKVPQALVELQAALQAEVSRSGFSIDTRAFKPHITMVRDGAHEIKQRTIPRIPWVVKSFSLLDSTQTATGTSYSVVKTWRMTGTFFE